MPHSTIESYLSTVYHLEDRYGRARTKPMADYLRCKMASVTEMVRRLAELGYLNYRRYHGTTLTGRGRRLALLVARRHRVLECFLAETLHMGWDEVHVQAERLQHVASSTLIRRMYDQLGRPPFDPHGAPIPTAQGRVNGDPGVPLDELADGATGTIARVRWSDASLLHLLSKRGLTLGATVHLQGREPMGGPFVVRTGRQTVRVERDVGPHVLVAQE